MAAQLGHFLGLLEEGLGHLLAFLVLFDVLRHGDLDRRHLCESGSEGILVDACVSRLEYASQLFLEEWVQTVRY